MLNTFPHDPLIGAKPRRLLNVKFGVFYEHQLPRPWQEGDEQRLLHEALEQVELADRLGYDYAWEVEHHFLEEYSHSSAPEVFLAAASQRTERIRLGHGIVQMPPKYNHPARVAERIATHTGQSVEQVEADSDRDRWFTAEEAKQYGIIDHVIVKRGEML